MTTASKRRTGIPAEELEHGDARRYRRGCRCDKCKAGANIVNIRRHYLRQTGRGLQRPPHRAASHIELLRAAGLDDRDIKRQADICPDVLYRIMRRHGTIHATTEKRILAVPVPETPVGITSRAYTSALGTHRRLRALVTAGWYAAELARRLGKDREYVVHLLKGRGGGKVAMFLADQVRQLYADLHNQSPHSAGLPPAYVERARRQAALDGWAGPDYWDDDDFDNPDFQPALSDDLKRDQLAEVRREEIEHFDLLGLSSHEIADKLGLAYTTVRNIVLELHSGQRRTRPREGANAPGPAVPLEVAA